MAKSRSEKIRQEEEKLKRECKTRKCTVLLLRLRHQGNFNQDTSTLHDFN